jgi:iron-sulfur cluster repair protein YtfE (RIC family)
MPEQVEPIAGLIRDHREIEEVVTEGRTAVSAAASAPQDVGLVAAALERLRDLEAFVSIDLMLHIAKEERVLFPALREAAEAATGDIIEDMLAQHDEVRERHAMMRGVLESIDHHHDEVREETGTLSNGLDAAAGEPSPEDLESLHETVKRLDWILQGHFIDEEMNLFEPALEIFDANTLAGLAARIDALNAEYL